MSPRTIKTLIGLALTSAVPVTAAAKGDHQPTVIDMHFHALPAASMGSINSPICAPFEDWPAYDPGSGKSYIDVFNAMQCSHRLISPSTDDAVKAQALAALRRWNVLAVTSGSAKRVEAWRRDAPEHILSAIGFDLDDAPPPETLRRLHAEGRLQVMGEIGSQYDGAAPNDPRLEPYYALAEELDIPLALHVGLGPPGAPYQGMERYRMRNSNPLLLEDVLVRHPRLRLYVMHAGWPMLPEMMALLYAHPQVYVDLGVIDYILPKREFERYLRTLVDAGFEKRIMYGSDNMVWPQAVAISIANIRGARFLTRAQKQDILHDNAARFLRLPTLGRSG